jgi:hypothetical protein
VRPEGLGKFKRITSSDIIIIIIIIIIIMFCGRRVPDIKDCRVSRSLCSVVGAYVTSVQIFGVSRSLCYVVGAYLTLKIAESQGHYVPGRRVPDICPDCRVSRSLCSEQLNTLHAV